MSENQQDKFTSSAFSGELDADDLAFLSDQQSEMIVGGYSLNSCFNGTLDKEDILKFLKKLKNQFKNC